MAKIVLAMATTHGPQLHTDVDKWHLRVLADKARKHPFRGKELSFEELAALRKPEDMERKSAFEAQKGYHARCHAAMDKLADKWDEVKPDIAVILGNDQNEIYETDTLNPAFMVFYGDKIPHHPQDKADLAKMPPGVAEAESGHAVPEYTEYHQDDDGQRVRRHGLQGLAEEDAQRRQPRLRPHLSSGHARQGGAERARLPEHVLSAEPAHCAALLPVRPDRRPGHLQLEE
jgi:OH-DDVA oxygenase/3-O-methylgallate 3,4-dioxygenase